MFSSDGNNGNKKHLQPPLSGDVPLGVDLHRAIHRASPWNLLLSVNCFFCQYQMVGGPWAWHHSRHQSYLWHSSYWIVYPGREGGRDCVGVWCPPSFSVSVASPLYLILPGHQLLPERHLLRHKTLPLRTTPLLPTHPPIHPSTQPDL